MKGIQNRMPFIVNVTDNCNYQWECQDLDEFPCLFKTNLIFAAYRQIHHRWIISNASDNGFTPSSQRWIYYWHIVDTWIIDQAKNMYDIWNIYFVIMQSTYTSSPIFCLICSKRLSIFGWPSMASKKFWKKLIEMSLLRYILHFKIVPCTYFVWYKMGIR